MRTKMDIIKRNGERYRTLGYSYRHMFRTYLNSQSIQNLKSSFRIMNTGGFDTDSSEKTRYQGFQTLRDFSKETAMEIVYLR